MARRALLTLILAPLLCLSGCFVWIDDNPGDVSSSYRSALARVERVESRHRSPGRHAHSVRVWAYDSGERRLIELSVPLWIVRKFAEDRTEIPVDLGRGLVRANVSVEDLLSRGPGLVLSAEKDEERVLVWLE